MITTREMLDVGHHYVCISWIRNVTNETGFAVVIRPANHAEGRRVCGMKYSLHHLM